MDGWALLDMLKRTPGDPAHPRPRHLGGGRSARSRLAMGAYAFTSKPVEREAVVSALEGVKRLDEQAARRIVVAGEAPEALKILNQSFDGVETADEAAPLLAEGSDTRPGCVVVELGAGFTATEIEQIKANEEGAAPLVIYAPGDLDAEEERRLRFWSSAASAASPARRSSWWTR
jgi:hypothetical protein